MTLTLLTYGGGEILRNVFNSIAILLNVKGGLIQPLMIIAISCGALWAVSKAFFTSQAEAILSKFFIPLVAIVGILMMPTSAVRIEDVLTGKSFKIDHVPWFLARVTELISTIGYQITDGLETVMHVPNDTSYNKTGMVFGSDIALDINRYKISNAVLEQNLRRFSKQCIFYDIALNRYTIDDLKKTTDLWKFLEDKSSKVRMIPYTDPLDGSKKTTYLTCQEAIKAMGPIFEKEKNYYAAQDIIKDLPLTFQALTGLQKEKEKLISQQLMMHVISGEFSGDKFAKTRAHAQQKSTYLVLGSLASNSLITMRAVLEAIIYVSIIFVVPLSVLPGGLSFISNWIWLMIWIQLWPPFYAIINYIMQTVAQGRANDIFMGLSDPEKGLSLFTSIGLTNLHEDIYALSGYLAASIPFVAYAIVKGGVSSFIHLAGSMMTPAHAAATSAAGEQTSGNYSLASTHFGQLSYNNATGFQKNLAPSMSTGSFTDNRGNLSVTYAGNEMLLREQSSEARWGFSSDKSIIESYQTSKQNAEVLSESKQKSYMESLSSHGRTMTDLTSHLAKSENFSIGVSEREAVDIQESARYMQNQAHSLAEQYGLRDHEGMAVLISTPTFGGMLPSGSYDRNASTEAISNSAMNIVNTEEYQSNYQRLKDFSKSSAQNSLNDEGVRFVEAYTKSLDEVTSSQEQYQVAKTHSDQISETASWVTQNASLLKQNHNQDLVNWATQKLGPAEAQRILTHQGSEEERTTLVHEFIDNMRHEQMRNLSSMSKNSLEGGYETAKMPLYDRVKEQEKHRIASDQLRKTSGLAGGSNNGYEMLTGELQVTQAEVENRIGRAKQNIENQSENLTRALDTKDEELRISRLWAGPSGDVKMVGQYSKDSLPLGWFEKE